MRQLPGLSVAVAAWAALAGALPSRAADPVPPTHIFTVTGYPGDIDESGGSFTLANMRARILVPDGSERATYMRVLDAAIERLVAVTIRFDGTAGRLDPDGDHIDFPLCSISLGNSRFGDEAANCPPRSNRTMDAGQLLALGWAQGPEQPDAARLTLTRALESTPALSPGARALAFEARAEASEALAGSVIPSDPSFDRHWADALADYRHEAALATDSARARYAVANALLTLGAYDDALDEYHAIGRAWPEEAFEVSIRIGALYRQRGDYARALRILDNRSNRDNAQMNGMKFHYHRAWTLWLLGRNPEAAREIDEGLDSQPDFAPALTLRACVRARLGQFADAVADEQHAFDLLNANATDAPWSRREIEATRATLVLLREAAQPDHMRAVEAQCASYFSRWSHPRARSPLLPRRP